MAVRNLARRVPDREDSGGLPIGELDACFEQLKRLEGAVAAVKSRLVTCAAGAKAHDAAGMTGTDAYLRDRLRVSAREAKKQSELARGLEGMEGTADALAEGRLGNEQAAALGRASRNGRLGSPEDVERDLLADATTSSPEQLQERIRRAEQAAAEDELRRSENRAYGRRRASCSRRADGMWQLHALLDPVGGEELATALRAYTKPDPVGTPLQKRRTPQQRAADGLTEMASAALSAGAPVAGGVRPHISVIVRPAPEGGSDHPQDGAEPASAPGNAARPHGGTESPVHETNAADTDGSGSSRLHHEGSEAGRSDPSSGRDVPPSGEDPSAPATGTRPGPAATTGNGATISPDAASRLMCDARITRIVMDAKSQILDVGRATRTWSPAQRTAVTARDRHCRGPSCDRPPDWCHIHHIQWWSKGGGTDLDNGILLCTHHHRMVHERKWTVELDTTTAEAAFTAPNGERTTTLPRGSPHG